MRRRDFLMLLGGAAAGSPFVARAQQAERVRRIGVLMAHPESDPEFQGYVAALQEGLQKLGWTEGRNIRIDTRWPTPDDPDSIQRFAKELVALAHGRCPYSNATRGNIPVTVEVARSAS